MTKAWKKESHGLLFLYIENLMKRLESKQSACSSKTRAIVTVVHFSSWITDFTVIPLLLCCTLLL